MNLNFKQEKYAVLRTQNVEKLAQRFGDDPSLAVILGDSKLGSEPLLLTRKENLDKLMGELKKVSNADEVEIFLESCELFIMVAEKEKIEDPIFNKAVKILKLQIEKVRKEFGVILSPNPQGQNQSGLY